MTSVPSHHHHAGHNHGHSHENTVPRGALRLAIGLVVLVLAMTLAVRLGWMEPAASPNAHRAVAKAEVMVSRTLHFADSAGGSVSVTDANTGETIQVLGEEGSGFIRGVMRGLARERRQHNLGAAAPFVLRRWSDGSLSLTDTATGRDIELGAFGPDNRVAFERLLPGKAQ